MFFGSALTAIVVVGFGAFLATGDDIGSETDFIISADGILNEQLMPITYLMLDGGGCDSSSRESCALGKEAEGRTEPSDELPLKELGSDASYSSALSTLEFHRTMINLYRCKGFLAKRIINVVPAQSQLFKRMSTAQMPNSSALLLSQDPTDGMLYDPGSSGYKEWLTKTSTLDDIYENFLSMRKANDTVGRNLHQAASTTINRVSESASQPASNSRLSQEEYFDEGIITGYAMQPDQVGGVAPGGVGNYDRYGQQQQQQQQQQHNHHQHQYGSQDLQLRHSKYQRGLLQGEADGGGGYEASRGDYGYHHHHHAPIVEYEEKTLDKSSSLLGLKDLFDIALTTLAYLSFGMFILQVIMCITMTKSDSSMMILPTTPEVEVEEDEGRRFARSLTVDGSVRTRELNQLARYVLDSIDAIGSGGPEPDRCLQACLCRANRFSRTLTSIPGYWVSVWSFGVSWLARYKHPSRNNPSFALKCMSAALIGLGNGKCAELYPCGGGKKSKPS
uniref:Protein tweety homolog n=1 Tax=Anopheles melas TaxID=34690 RepID=A0A182UEU1_9DIPT